MPRVKKKKKRTGEEKKGKKKSLNERETLSFEQQILDNNRQLARLRTSNKELEEEVENAKERYKQLEEDRSDIVAYLKRNLEEKSEESKELNERIVALEELRKEELAAFKKKEDAMDLEYRTMESNLTAEVKLAAGKLNALEDWRLARLDLMQKFENQEKEIAEQEERHRETLYEAEKSLVIGKAMMKKEMEERLNDLAESLRKAINLRIAEATHRTIRENIHLNDELDDVLEICRELESENKERKEADRILRLQCELFEMESKITLNRTMKQRAVINKLMDEFQGAILLYGKAERENSRLATYKEISKNCEKKCEQLREKIRNFKQHLTKTKEDKEELLVELKKKNNELEKLKDILHRVKNCIKEAVQLQEDSEDYCANHLKRNLLISLQEILEEGNITSILECTASQMDVIECLYTKGSLGFVPSEEREDKTKENVEEEERFKCDCGYSEEIEGEEKLEEKLEEKSPSCVLSDISSNITSPRETISDEERKSLVN